MRSAHRAGLLDRVFHRSRVGMLVARLDDGLVLEANDGFAALIARPLGEILGADVFGLDVWGETGPRRARELLTDTGLIDGYDTNVRTDAGDTRIVRAWAETVDGPETLLVIRASDVDGRAAAKTRYLELRETEVRFRAMVEHMPAITYTQVEDPTTETGLRDVYVSPQIEALLGVPADQWLEEPDAWVRQIHPEDRARVCEQIRSTPRGRFHSEYRMIARDGSIHWFRDEAIHVEDPANGVALWQGVMLDITDAKLAADHHAATEAKYRALVEQLPAVVYLGEYGDEGEWLYISPHIETVLGYTPQEWLAHPAPMGQLTHPEDLDRARAEEERSLRNGTPYRAEYRMRARDGRWVWILDEAGVVRDDDGNPLCMQGLMYDITERKEAEERLV
ncbi:MAG TPA: PAS domain-containing protein, partial [Actinomycetota bacterium]|nr:PAS domain-containing protein [Actinomycetota bacterium]